MELKQRKNLRLQSFDYSSAKYYFVTICTKNRARLFGQIVGNGLDRSAAMELSSLGKTAEKCCWKFLCISLPLRWMLMSLCQTTSTAF